MDKAIHKEVNLDVFATASSIITLTPEKTMIEKMEYICDEELELDAKDIRIFLENGGLEKHAFPVITPPFNSPKKLNQFEEKNCSLLIDMMLSTWPFPVECWGYRNKNMELFNKIIDVRYYPAVLNFITEIPRNTLDLAALFFTPNTNLISHITESVESGKLKPNEEERVFLDILCNYGIAIICNQLDSKEAEKQPNWAEYMFDPKNYLHSQNIKILNTLFTIFFHHRENWPDESSDEYINQWFDTKVLIQGIANMNT